MVDSLTVVEHGIENVWHEDITSRHLVCRVEGKNTNSQARGDILSYHQRLTGEGYIEPTSK